jgi:hypothetical protein
VRVDDGIWEEGVNMDEVGIWHGMAWAEWSYIAAKRMGYAST